MNQQMFNIIILFIIILDLHNLLIMQNMQTIYIYYIFITPNISKPTSITVKLIIEIIKTEVFLFIVSTYSYLK